MTNIPFGEIPRVGDAALPSIPALDHGKYAAHIGDLDLTEAQQRAFLETVWSIMIGFVDLGWGLDSIQQLIADGSKLSSEFQANAVENRDAQHALTFNEVAIDGGEKDRGHHE